MIWRFWVLAVGLTLLMGGVILLAHTTTEPIRLVVYSAEVNGNRDIYIKTIDGKFVRRLTNSATQDVAPAWSPDGKWIAFVSINFDGREVKSKNISLISPEGHSIEKVIEIPTYSSYHSLTWSPDSQWIEIYYDSPSGQFRFIVSINGDKSYDLIYHPSPTWSSQGDWLFSNSISSDNVPQLFGVTALKPSTGEIITLVENSQAPYGKPILSPNEEWLLFAANIDSVCPSFYVVKPDGSELGCIDVGDIHNTVDPQWLPDSQFIIFLSQNDKNYSLSKISFDGTNDQVLAELNEAHEMLVTKNNILLIGKVENVYGLYSMNVDRSNMQIIVSKKEYLSHLRWVRDSNSVAFSGDGTIYFINENGTNLQKINTDPYPYGWFGIWSPLIE